LQRCSDDELQQQRWSGLVQFALKYQQVKDFARYLDTLLPWIRELAAHSQGDLLGRIVLNYLLDGIEADNITLRHTTRD
jgi:hypothetical protein